MPGGSNEEERNLKRIQPSPVAIAVGDADGKYVVTIPKVL